MGKQFSEFVKIITTSIRILMAQPKLVLPKMIVAILYGIAIYFESQVLIQVLPFLSTPPTQEQLPILLSLFFSMVVLLIFNIIIYIIDTITSALYPSLVKQLPKKVSFQKAIVESKERFVPLILTSLAPLALTFILSILVAFIFALLGSNATLQLTVSLIIGLITVFLFYLLIPVLMLEKKGIMASLSESIKLSFQEKKNIFLLSILAMFISIAKMILALFVSDPVLFTLFIVLIIFTGLFHAYNAITTQTTYFSIKNKTFFKKLK